MSTDLIDKEGLSPTEKAYLLLASVCAALKNGVKHFDKQNRLLTDEEAVIKAMALGGGVTVDESERRQVTTVEAELEALIKKTTKPDKLPWD